MLRYTIQMRVSHTYSKMWKWNYWDKRVMWWFQHSKRRRLLIHMHNLTTLHMLQPTINLHIQRNSPYMWKWLCVIFITMRRWKLQSKRWLRPKLHDRARLHMRIIAISMYKDIHIPIETLYRHKVQHKQHLHILTDRQEVQVWVVGRNAKLY